MRPSCVQKKVLLHIDFDFMINEMQELLRSMHEARDLLMGMVDTVSSLVLHVEAALTERHQGNTLNVQ